MRFARVFSNIPLWELLLVNSAQNAVFRQRIWSASEFPNIKNKIF